MAAYQDIKRIGSGGNAEVSECARDSDGERFAKKRLLPAADDDTKDRFRREVRLLAKLDHPNIVSVVATHLDNEPLWFVMPLYQSSLDEQFPEIVGDLPRIAKIFGAILDAVEHAHGEGVIHRDLKPGNVLMNSDDDVVVSDFGLGRLVDSRSTRLARQALIAAIEFLDFVLAGPHPMTTRYGKSVAYTKAKYLSCWHQYTALVPKEERLPIGEPVDRLNDPGMKILDDLWTTQGLTFESFVDPILSQIKAAVPLIAPERAKDYFDLVAETPIQLVLEYKDNARYSASAANGKVFVGVDGLERSWAYSYLFAGGYALFVEGTRQQISGPSPEQLRQHMLECLKWAIDHDVHKRRPVYADELPRPRRDLSQATAIDKLHYNTFLGAIAWITLHEIAHVVLKHPTDATTPIEEQKQQEFEADAWAAQWLLTKAPENWRVFRMNGIVVGLALAAFLELWTENDEPEAAPSDHPTYPERLVAVLDKFAPLCGSIEQQYGTWVAGTVLIYQRAALGHKEEIFEGISPFTQSRDFILKARDAYPKG